MRDLAVMLLDGSQTEDVIMKGPACSIVGIAVFAFATAGCDNSSPVQPTPPACSYAVSTNTVTFGAAGGSTSIGVTAGSQCTWTATSDRGWASIASGANGTGNGQVTVAASANTSDSARTGTLTVAGQSVAIRQDGAIPCSFEIAPASAAYSKDEASGQFSVTAPAGCAWSAASTVSWLTVTGGASGAGNGTVTYAVSRNREAIPRAAAITLADRRHEVAQQGDTGICEYSVAPVRATACMAAPYTLSATVTTSPGCAWTVTAGAPWIAVTSSQSNAGTGTVTFRVTDNYDAPRQDVVMVRWPTPTAGQNIAVSQAGCRYAVSTTAITAAGAGGVSRFDVYQQSDPLECGGPLQNGCVWTAQADVPWITVTTSMPQAGDNPVSFTVAANDSGAVRVGTIRVRDQMVRVTQPSR